MTTHTLKCLRHKYKLTKLQMSEVVGLDYGLYCEIENGNVSITPRVANKILKAFAFGREPRNIVAITDNAILFE